MKSTLLIGLVAGCAAIAGFALQRSIEVEVGPAAPAESVIGQAVPEFSFIDLAGAPVESAQFAGQPLIINLWATWCGPCREEMPVLNDLAAQLQPSGLNIVGVALDEPARVAEFLNQIPVSYTVAITETLAGIQFAKALGNSNGVLPYTIFIDRNGHVNAVKRGQLSARAARRAANQLL